MLAPDESILLEAEAQGSVGIWRFLDPGRAYLTPLRIIWMRREQWAVRCLWPVHLVPQTLSIPIAYIQRVFPNKELSRRAWLLIVTQKQRYSLRLGREPFFWVRDSPAITREWSDKIQELREAHRTRIQS